MFSTKIYVDTNRNNALMLRITNNRKKAELSLGFQMPEDTFADIMSSKPKIENLRFKSLLSEWLAAIENLKVELAKENRGEEDVKTLKNLVRNAIFGKGVTKEAEESSHTNDVTFQTYFKEFAKRKSNGRTKALYLATLSRMEAFDSRLADMNFEDVTIRWLTDFDSFLSKSSPSQNARNIHFRNIRTVINAAIDDELTSHYPFRRFKIRPIPTRKRSLSLDNIQKVFHVEELEEWEIKYLDFFKLSFMLIGINVIDLCSLTEITDGRIEYNRAKTHKPYSIKVEPEAMEIIERHKGRKHLLDFTDNYANYRHFYNNLCKGLDSIKKKLEITELTSYWARHSWATIAASLDIPKETIAAALGHGGNTVTDIYIDFNQKKIDEANRRVLNWVLYGKR